nr:hypothetical protein [Candidatus Chlamydia sanziniae]
MFPFISTLFCSLGNTVFAVPHYVVEEERFHIDRFNFSGYFPDMESMEIEAQYKKRVEFDVTGDFPKLESIVYKGSFGYLRAKFKGHYPCLTLLNFLCTSCKMDMDFRGDWLQSGSITIRNEEEPIVLLLPKNVGVIVHTTTSLKGKVCIEGSFVKQGRGIWNKTYHNSSVGSSPVTLVFHVRSSGSGTITLR